MLDLFAKKYKIDYCGEKFFYKGAKDSYRAGEKVTLYYDLIATDTSYTFIFDGRTLLTDYDSKKGFVIEFTMPDHDAVLRCRTRNTMLPDCGKAVVYVHGKGGSADECEFYKPLFPGCDVMGLDYKTFTPWEAGREIRAELEKLSARYEDIVLIANSIGAFFCMNAEIDGMIEKAFFISPIVDMERLISDMMAWANVTEDELKACGVIPTELGDDLSWEYLSYVREHPIKWSAPTEILYGGGDELTSYEIVKAFAEEHGANLTVMENGEHWFHTDEQLAFLKDWITSY